MNKQLIVFFGKPGVGKTTLIREAFDDGRMIDVKSFVLAYQHDGVVPQQLTLEGYKDMYRHVKGLDDDVVVLELGTNHPEFNISTLHDLRGAREIIIFLCTASVETLLHRLQERSATTNMGEMHERVRRTFPDKHIALLEALPMDYVLLDMEQPWTDNVILVNQRLRA